MAEAANAITRLRRMPPNAPLSQHALRDTSILFHRLDERIADLIEQGTHERLYFARTKIPRLVHDDGQMTHRVRQRFNPIASPRPRPNSGLVHKDLRPPPASTSPPPGARDSRLELNEAITHRPPSRAGELGL